MQREFGKNESQVMDPLDNESLWHYPRSLPLGELELETEHELILHIAVPVGSKLTSAVRGLTVDPEFLVPGANEVVLRIPPLEQDTLIRGKLWLCRPSRRELGIEVQGHVLRVPDAKPRGPSRRLVWQPGNWQFLKSELDSLPLHEVDTLNKLMGILGGSLDDLPPPPPALMSLPDPLPPLSPVKVGPPSQLAKESVDERWKAESGFCLVRSDRFNGQDIVFALRSVCTHQGCTTRWAAREQRFRCSCGSAFNIAGIHLEGPAQQALERLKIRLGDDGRLVVDPSQRYQLERGQWSNRDSFAVVPQAPSPPPPLPPSPLLVKDPVWQDHPVQKRRRPLQKRPLAMLLAVPLGLILVALAALLFPPSSTVHSLPSTTTSPQFTVSWSGSDGLGLGIASYTIYFRDNGGSDQLFLTNTTQTSATYTGQAGHTYGFYSVATNKLGRVQPTPSAPQATTSVATNRRGLVQPTPSAPQATTKVIELAMVLIPAGEFTMGPDPFKADSPAHRVRITRPFCMGRHEVTLAEWRKVMGQELNGGSDPALDPSRYPVERVTWFEAIDFCNRLSDRENRPRYYERDGDNVRILGGVGYRLPTEAEWEYACRGEPNNKEKIPAKNWFGNDELARHAWYLANSGNEVQAVEGDGKENPFGLCDMLGNVDEWCWDWFGSYPRDNVVPLEDPSGPPTGEYRITRGGRYRDPAEHVDCAFRNMAKPKRSWKATGFRVACFPQ